VADSSDERARRIRAALEELGRGTGIFDSTTSPDAMSVLRDTLHTGRDSEVPQAIEYVLHRELTRPRGNRDFAKAARAYLGFDYRTLSGSPARMRTFADETSRHPHDVDALEGAALWWLARTLLRAPRGDNGTNTETGMVVPGSEPTTGAIDITSIMAKRLHRQTPTMAVITQLPTTLFADNSVFRGQWSLGGNDPIVLDILIDRAPGRSQENLAVERDATGLFSAMHTIGGTSYFPVMRWKDSARLRDVTVRYRNRRDSTSVALISHLGSSREDIYLSPEPADLRRTFPTLSLARDEKLTIDWLYIEAPPS